MQPFNVHILASGSKGNSLLLRAGNTSILIDAGISARRITAGLAKAGVRPEQLSAILVTHEHNDHVSGLPVFSRRACAPIFTREKTWLSMEGFRSIERSYCRLLPEGDIKIGDITVRPFSVPHDAADPVGFEFFFRESKCSLATDLGFAGSRVKEALSGSGLIILEANHDAKMLSEGGYPRFLQERIRGSRGHLSNMDAGMLLADVVDQPEVEVFLVHLSQENNRPALAEEAVSGFLAKKGLLHRACLKLASQDTQISNCNEESDII